MTGILESKQLPSVTMIGGAGRIGLPFSIHAALAGYDVHLVDTNQNALSQVMEGFAPFKETGLDEKIRLALSTGRLSAANAIDSFSPMDLVVVFVGTPLVGESVDLGHLDLLLQEIVRLARPDTEVILRSTVSPGYSRRAQATLSRTGSPNHFAYWPERVLEGEVFREIASIPQIVGSEIGLGPRTQQLVDSSGTKVLECNLEEAEMAKLIANSLRFVLFNLANEFERTCATAGVDYDKVRSLVVEDYPRAQGLAKSGLVGGPCLQKDTAQLASVIGDGDPAILREVLKLHEVEPKFQVDRMEKLFDLQGMTVALLGLTFKPGSDDVRGSQALAVRQELLSRGAGVIWHDPYLEDSSELEEVLENADIVLVATAHEQYDSLPTEKPVFRP